MAQGLWFLVHHHHWVLTETPLSYPVVAPNRGIGPQCLHGLQKVVDGATVRAGQPQAQDVGLGGI